MRGDRAQAQVSAGDNNACQLLPRISLIWPATRQQAICRHPHGVNVGSDGALTGRPHLRCDRERATLRRRSAIWAELVYETEVPKESELRRVEEDVVGFDVAVNEPAIMAGSKADECLANPADHDVRREAQRIRPYESLRGPEFSDPRRNVWNIFERVRVEHFEYVLTPKGGQNSRLTVDVDRLRTRFEGLERDLLVLVRIVRAPNLVAAASEQSCHTVTIGEQAAYHRQSLGNEA